MGQCTDLPGLPMTLVANQLVASQLDCDLTMIEAIYKQCCKTNEAVQYYIGENARINQEKQGMCAMGKYMKEVRLPTHHKKGLIQSNWIDLSLKVFTNIGHCGPIIGIKRLGEIDENLFLDAACSSGISKVNAAKNRKAWLKKIQGHIWHPYKRITEDGRSEEVLDEEDETLKELKAFEALKEMDRYNSSGRTIVPELWNYKEGRKVTVVEAIDCLMKKIMDHEKEKNCNKRRRSSRFRYTVWHNFLLQLQWYTVH
ncbi:factor of DNA methylation 4-like [Panicum miliaceum]|uniref:Factor of DNA methylation 4-like n=1 Tax=Panicum miliaceum TaxID=4540 RepID=A0A3L6R4W8_PANMI|nr:factor of DNA methylation 4-like [Panicum miliaceum]